MLIESLIFQKMLSLSKKLTQLPLPRVYSGIQPTGIPHLGNYLGAVKQWADLAQTSTPINKDKFIYAIMDLHAMTVSYEKSKYLNSIHQTAACLIASGLNPEKVILYRQANVTQHSELYFLLSCQSLISDLNDMTQWKHKSEQHGALTGLYVYPVLMAADILLYRADLVPVGEDQVQHIQLTREIANRVNKKFRTKKGKYSIKLPKAKMSEDVARVKSLTNPTKKMSKSDPNVDSCLLITASNDQINTRIKNAVIDDDGFGLKNLQEIYASLGDDHDRNVIEDPEKLKTNLSELLISKISPIREEYEKLMSDRAFLKQILDNGADEAREIASVELKEIKKFMGLL